MTDTGLALADSQVSESARLHEHREIVHTIEDEMRKHPPIEIPVTHRFAHGVYAREAFIPKGTLATGRIHKFSQINIISLGDISVKTENGVIRLTAPATIVSPPGTKRLVYAHEDTVWTTILHSHETDVATLEAELVVDSEQEYARFFEAQHGKIVEIA